MPEGTELSSFCFWFSDSCYCDNSCVSDFSAFCEYLNWIPGAEADIVLTIRSENTATPEVYDL